MNVFTPIEPNSGPELGMTLPWFTDPRGLSLISDPPEDLVSIELAIPPDLSKPTIPKAGSGAVAMPSMGETI